MPNQALKSEIRKNIRFARNQVSQSDSVQAGKQLVYQLLKNNILKENQNIGCFLAFDGEIPTNAVINQCINLNACCYLPKLKPYKPNRLWFMPYRTDSTMRKNRYGIAEVDLPINQAIAVSKLDIVLLPLVAFDQNGNRLGMGGGYYDATFAHLRHKNNRPKFIGLAYQLQQVGRLPSDPWDLPLDGVCTENQFYPLARQKT